MRIAIISDTHFGDRMSSLTFRDGVTGDTVIGKEKYRQFLEALPRRDRKHRTHLDFLVMAGDTFDFSVADNYEAYAVGKEFFQRIKNDRVAGEVIYISGNHDFDLWHTIEYQINIIERIRKKRLPTQFRMSVPGVLDTRRKSAHYGFSIPGISVQKRPGRKYAGLFLDQITDPPTSFNFVYPNLYLATDHETILVTHGHYMEGFWSLIIEKLGMFAGDDLGLEDMIDLKEMVSLNFPTSQLASSGIGQAGALSKLAQEFVHEISGQNLHRVEKYYQRIDRRLREKIRERFGRAAGKIVHFFFNRWLKSYIFNNLSAIETIRYQQEYFNDRKIMQRFSIYFNATLEEIKRLNQLFGFHIGLPEKVIFGHTHQPIAFNDPAAPRVDLSRFGLDRTITIYNTGGWVNKQKGDHGTEFEGAEVIVYESEKGFSSHRIL